MKSPTKNGDPVAGAAAHEPNPRFTTPSELSKEVVSVPQLAREYVLVAQVAAQAEQARKEARERLLTHVPDKYKGQGVTVTRTHRWQLNDEGKEALRRYKETLVARGMAEMIDSPTVSLWRKGAK